MTEAFETPIFKNTGSKDNVHPDHPVNQMSLIPKICISMIADFLNDVFKNIIISRQHGFVKSRSIETNLLIYLDLIVESLELGYALDKSI